MKKLSSYQKLKKRAQDLELDIYNLVENEKEIKGIEVRTKWKIKFESIRLIWLGKRSGATGKFTVGLIAMIVRGAKTKA